MLKIISNLEMTIWGLIGENEELRLMTGLSIKKHDIRNHILYRDSVPFPASLRDITEKEKEDAESMKITGKCIMYDFRANKRIS